MQSLMASGPKVKGEASPREGQRAPVIAVPASCVETKGRSCIMVPGKTRCGAWKEKKSKPA